MKGDNNMTNEELAEILSDALYSYSMEGDYEEYKEELYKYLPKDKVDEYITEYDEEADDPRSGIWEYNETEFVEKFRIDKEEDKTFLQEYTIAQEKLKDTVTVVTDGYYSSDYGFLQIVKTPEENGNHIAYGYVGGTDTVWILKVKPQYAEDIMKYYALSEDEEKFNNAWNSLWNDKDAYKPIYSCEGFDDVMEAVHNNENGQLSAFVEDTDIQKSLIWYLKNDYTISDDCELNDKYLDELETLIDTGNLKTTKQICDKVYDFIEQIKKDKNEIDIDR